MIDLTLERPWAATLETTPQRAAYAAPNTIAGIPIAESTKTYVEDRELMGLSPMTTKGESSFLKCFAIWLAKQGVLTTDELRIEHIRSYLIEESKHLKHSTVCTKKAAIKGYAEWIVGHEYATLNIDMLPKLGRPREDEYSRPHLTDAEVTTLYQHFRSRFRKYRSWTLLRQLTMFTVLFSTGVRIGELLALDVDDVDIEGKELTIRRSKGKRLRYVPLPPSAIPVLRLWVATRRRLDAPTSALFITAKARRLTQTHIRSRLCVDSWVKTQILWSPHVARRYVLTRLARVNIYMAMMMAGHSDIKMTVKYVTSDRTSLKSTIAANDPLKGVR